MSPFKFTWENDWDSNSMILMWNFGSSNGVLLFFDGMILYWFDEEFRNPIPFWFLIFRDDISNGIYFFKIKIDRDETFGLWPILE